MGSPDRKALSTPFRGASPADTGGTTRVYGRHSAEGPTEQLITALAETLQVVLQRGRRRCFALELLNPFQCFYVEGRGSPCNRDLSNPFNLWKAPVKSRDQLA